MSRFWVAVIVACCGLFAARASASIDNSGSVSVSVLDLASNPVPHAWVVVRPMGYIGTHIHRYVGVDGVTMMNLPPGAYSAHAHHAGVGSGQVGFSVLPGQATNVNLWLTWGHYYGYYHWYRIHRVGVSHFAREEHLRHMRELAAMPTDAHGRKVHERTTVVRNSNERTTPTAGTNGQTSHETGAVNGRPTANVPAGRRVPTNDPVGVHPPTIFGPPNPAHMEPRRPVVPAQPGHVVGQPVVN